MLKTIKWSIRASEEYLVVLSYLISEWGIEQAETFQRRVEEQTDRIVRSPKHFPIINKKKMIRKCVVTPHNTIFFREGNNEIDILTFFDTRQNPNKLNL